MKGTSIAHHVLTRAAKIALSRNYTYFLLTKEDAAARGYFAPGLGLRYGRSPYGFGNADQTIPDSLTAALSLGSARMQWTVHMISSHEPASSHAYNARALLANR